MTDKFFRATIRQDAWIQHEALLSSKEHGVKTVEQAVHAMQDQWKGHRKDIKLIEESVPVAFDNADCEPDDIEEIDQEEYEAEIAMRSAAPDPITLDWAKERFEACPTPKNAGTLLEVAKQYEADDMITDDTWLNIVGDVTEFLKNYGD
jgi:hypothetical protein